MNTRKRSRALAEASPESDNAANEAAATSLSASKRQGRTPRYSLESANTSRTSSTNGDLPQHRSPPQIRIKRSITTAVDHDSEGEGVSPKTITAASGFPPTTRSASRLSPKQRPTIMSSDELAPSSSSPSPQDTPVDVSPPAGEASISPPDDKTPALTTVPPKSCLQNQPLKASARTTLRTAQGVESSKDMKDDFADMGMSKKKVRELAGVKESLTPDGKVIHKRTSPSAAEGREKRVKRDSKGKGPAYEGLQLGGDPNWILFDPSHGYSDFFDAQNGFVKLRDPPLSFEQYETYRPGKKRILEYNVKTHSVRLKTTPLVLEGKEVLYAASGPKIVNVIEAKQSVGRKGSARVSKSRLSQIKVEEAQSSDEGGGEVEQEEDDELYV